MKGFKIELQGKDVFIETEKKISKVIVASLDKKEIRGNDNEFVSKIVSLQKRIKTGRSQFSIDEIRTLSQFLDIDLQKYGNRNLKGLPDELDNVLGIYQKQNKAERIDDFYIKDEHLGKEILGTWPDGTPIKYRDVIDTVLNSKSYKKPEINSATQIGEMKAERLLQDMVLNIPQNSYEGRVLKAVTLNSPNKIIDVEELVDVYINKRLEGNSHTQGIQALVNHSIDFNMEKTGHSFLENISCKRSQQLHNQSSENEENMREVLTKVNTLDKEIEKEFKKFSSLFNSKTSVLKKVVSKIDLNSFKPESSNSINEIIANIQTTQKTHKVEVLSSINRELDLKKKMDQVKHQEKPLIKKLNII